MKSQVLARSLTDLVDLRGGGGAPNWAGPQALRALVQGMKFGVIKTTLLLMFGLLFAPHSLAQDPLTLGFDCFLQSTSVSCNELQSAFLGAVPLKSGDDGIQVDVRANRVDAGIRYRFHFYQWKSGTKDIDRDRPDFVIDDRVADALPRDAVLLRLVGDMQRGLAPFMALKKASSGALVLELDDPGELQSNVRKDSDTIVYFKPEFSMAYEQNTLERFRARSFGTLNRSTPKTRLKLGYFAGYERITDESEGVEEIFTQTFLGSYGSAVFSPFNAGWKKGTSIAALYLVAHDSADNQLYTLRPSLAAEWVLRPFLENNSTNFGVQYRVGGEHVVFLENNVLDNPSETFLFHQAKAFASWHLSRVDLEVSADFKSLLDNIDFSSVGGRGSISVRLTDNLRAGLNGRLSFRNRLINAPKEEADETLEQIFGGNFGDVSSRVNFVVSYTFGNALLDRQDRRFSQ